MTRRIATAILITVWAILLAGGLSAYMVTRSILLTDLDDTLMARAMSLPEVERPANIPRAAAAEARDRFLVKNALGQTIARPTTTTNLADSGVAGVPAPLLISAEFARIADGARVRTITVRAFARRPNPTTPLLPVTIVYSGSADGFDQLLWNLGLTLGTVGLLGGALTAAIAVAVSRAALSPMLRSSDLLANVNENSLNQRIKVESLPVELAPVGVKINEMLQRLENSFAQRKRFMADASHELRTPVAALVTTLEVTLRRARSPEEYGRILKTCLSDAQLLRTLVETLMDQVRAERFGAGTGSAQGSAGLALDDLAPVNLSHLLRQCAAIVDVLAREKGVAIVQHFQDTVVLITSESRMRAIALNLLSNAVEYTPAGGSVTLTLQALDSPHDGMAQQAKFEVHDTGIGIAPEDLAHLFEPFYRADKVRGHEKQHLGLGLHLVKTHVEALGGTISVTSEVGEGSTFLVHITSHNKTNTLPVDESPETSENIAMKGRPIAKNSNI